MKKVGLLLAAGLVTPVLLFAAFTYVYHSRRFQACSEELAAAVHSRKTFEAFSRDPRPDGLWKRYSVQQREQLIADVIWDHSAKDAADVKAMSKRAHASAIFLFGDMVYVLFFDEGDRLQEFVCLGN